MVIVHTVFKPGTGKIPTQAVKKAERKMGWHQINLHLHFPGKVLDLTLFLKNWIQICLVIKCLSIC